MYSIKPIDFGGALNGRDAQIMSSSETADLVIKEFKKRIKRGMDPNRLVDKIYKEYSIDEDLIMDTDIRRINKELNTFCRFL